MKKIFFLLISILLLFTPICYAEEFDTNIVSKGDEPMGASSTLYKFWGYYKTTGTRYVIRVYDWNTESYIAVPTKYYINHVYGYKSNGSIDKSKQVVYLGVDKTSSGKYEVVKSGSSIFTDSTYSHVLQWYDNSNVSNFGLSENDIKLLADLIKTAAEKNGDTAVAKNMQDVIDDKVPYDVRAEILFLMKMPGTSGNSATAKVTRKRFNGKL